MPKVTKSSQQSTLKPTASRHKASSRTVSSKAAAENAAAVPVKSAKKPDGSEQTGIHVSGKRISWYRFRDRRQRARELYPTRLPAGWNIMRDTLRVLLSNWKLFGGIVLVNAVLSVLLVHAFTSGINQESLKSMFSGGGRVAIGIAAFFLILAGSGGDPAQSSGAYEVFLTIITSLAIIWAYRQVTSGHGQVRIRDAYYRGMYPLVPVLLIFLVICIQMLPALIGALLYSAVAANSIAISFVEVIIWLVILLVLLLISLLMISSSVFAIYIVTIPDMTPKKALRSARELVRYRRWTLLRKILFLPSTLLVASIVITLPFILFAAPLAVYVFFILSMLSLPVVHGYMYTLYKELLV